MYYIEKVINGKLMCKYSADGKWLEVSYESLLERYIDLKERVKK